MKSVKRGITRGRRIGFIQEYEKSRLACNEETRRFVKALDRKKLSPEGLKALERLEELLNRDGPVKPTTPTSGIT